MLEATSTVMVFDCLSLTLQMSLALKCLSPETGDCLGVSMSRRNLDSNPSPPQPFL